MKITTHTLVKNEEYWIKPALLSVMDQVETMLVWDTGSTDKTIAIIKSINSSKIIFEQKGRVNRQQLVNLRNQQIKATRTPWIILLDGDEIWPKNNLIQLIKAIQSAKPKIIALVNRTRNCVRDIYHYLPDDTGKYQIGKWRGNIIIRAIRNLPGLKVVGSYPNEAYIYQGFKIQDQPDKLEFVDTWYYHVTHLKRTSWWHSLRVMDRLKKFKPGNKFT